MSQSRSRNPCVGTRYCSSMLFGRVANLSPSPTQAAVKRMDHKISEMFLHLRTSSLPPVLRECPSVKLGDRHERDHDYPADQKRTKTFRWRIALEEVRDNVRIKDDRIHLLALATRSSLLHVLTAATNSSADSSDGQKSATRWVKSSSGPIPCSEASVARSETAS